MRAVVLAAALALGALPAGAGPWFAHPFGELRAYHGDWLAVCNDLGQGPCRAVQTPLEPGETRVGMARLALERGPDGGMTITLSDLAMPEAGPATPRLFVDGREAALPAGSWAPGEPGLPGVLHSMAITDPALVADLLAQMKAGRWLELRHEGGAVTFSLRGVTAALAAIETQAGKQNR